MRKRKKEKRIQERERQEAEEKRAEEAGRRMENDAKEREKATPETTLAC